MTLTSSKRPPLDFDHRLGLALRAYAAEVPSDADHSAIARAAATAAQRRSRAWPGAMATWPRSLRIGLGVALLLGATVVGLVLVGAFRDRSPMVVTPHRELAGAWLSIVDRPGAQGSERVIHLNVNWAVLIRDWEGNPLPWAGHVVEVRPREGAEGWEIEIEAPAPCGNASYRAELESPDQLLALRVIVDQCAERSELLTSSTWTRPGMGYLVPRETYDMAGFSEPFTFIGPANDVSGGMPALMEQREPGIIRLSGPESWDATIVDDGRRRSDPCDATSSLEELPATPNAVRVWLESLPGVVVAKTTDIPVDGRVAVLFNLESTPTDCVRAALVSAEGGQVFLTDLVYAIPTGDDTILFLVSTLNNPFGPTQRQATDIVRTMRFE